jgi:hypothetical protein
MTTTMTPADTAAQVRALVESGHARELRIKAGYTLETAGRACGGVHASAVLHWERGRAPRGRNLLAYARFLRKLEAAK